MMPKFEQWWKDQESGAPSMVFDSEEAMARAAYEQGKRDATEWQPIETAPKDGTMFLCWVSAERYSGADGECSSYSHDVSQTDFCWWRAGPAEMPEAGYFDPSCGQIGDSQGVTHWIPLPQPPISAAQKEKP